MSALPSILSATKRFVGDFGRDRRGTAAADMVVLGFPFILLILGVAQMGMYYMAQMALNAGTVKAAESLRADFATGATPVTPSGSDLKTSIVAGAGTGVNATGLIVEVQPLANLDGGAVAITDGTTNYGSAWTPLVLRSKYSFTPVIPFVGSTWNVSSSALVRRQGQ